MVVSLLMGSDEPLVFRDLEINGGGATATATATVRFGLVRDLWGNLLKVVFGTKLAVLFLIFFSFIFMYLIESDLSCNCVPRRHGHLV